VQLRWGGATSTVRRPARTYPDHVGPTEHQDHGGGPASPRRLPAGTVGAVLRRPDLWATALGTAVRLAPTGWWRRPPFLPLPAEDYLRFRMATAYGGDGQVADASPEDLVTYLAWCRDWPDGR
jgi:hypothetical protein